MHENLTSKETDSYESNQPEDTEYPAFDPENAKRLQLQAKIAKEAEKLGYNESITKALTAILPEFADYYDDEELIMQTLRECPIHLQGPDENANGFLREYFDDDTVTLPIIAGGVFYATPQLDNNGQPTVKKLLYLRNYGGAEDLLQDTENLSILVHELGHAIGATGKEPILEENGVVRVDGGSVIERYAPDENGKLQMISNDGIGMEEFLNVEAQNQVMRKLLGDEAYRSKTYPILQDIAAETPPQLMTVLARDRVHGTNTAEQLLPSTALAQANQNLDKIANSFTLPVSEILRRGGKAIGAENHQLGLEVVDIFNQAKAA